MKKWGYLSLFWVLIMVLAPVSALAVANNDDGCAETITWMPESGGTNIKLNLRLACTADTGDGSLEYTLNDRLVDIDGRRAFSVVVSNGETPAKADSDLGIVDSRGLTLMSATGTGNGVDLINNSGTPPKMQEYLEGPNGDHYQMLHKAYPPTFTMTENDVLGGQVIIDIELMP